MVATIGDRRRWSDGEVAGRSRDLLDKAQHDQLDDDTFPRFMIVLGWTYFVVILGSLVLGLIVAGIAALTHSTRVGPYVYAVARSVYLGLLVFALIFQLHSRSARQWGDFRDTFFTRHFLTRRPPRYSPECRTVQRRPVREVNRASRGDDDDGARTAHRPCRSPPRTAEQAVSLR